MGLLDRFKKKSEGLSEESDVPPESPPDRAGPIDEVPADAAAAKVAVASESQGMFSRFRQGLKKTTQLLNTDIRDLFKKEGQLLDDEFLDRLFALLVRTDMGAGPASDIRQRLLHEYRGRVVHMDDLLAQIKVQLHELMSQQQSPIQWAEDGPTVIMVVGVNGSGKTTSIAKLAQSFLSQGKHVVLGAGDTYRAAAVQQLSVWAERTGAEIVKGQANADPASVAHRAVARALKANADVCIVDTAGRLQTQVNLMEQLSKIGRVITKQIPDAPHEVLLVLDATAGQNGISQAKGFSEAVQCSGIILAKLDGTAKGGVVIPIRQQFDLPVKYVGVGEKAEDLAVFDSHQFVEALFADLTASK